jgi:hypothetical protein
MLAHRRAGIRRVALAPLAAAAVVALTPAAPAVAAFGPAAPLPGVGSGAALTGAAIDSTGTATIVGSGPASGARRAFAVTIRPGAAPAAAAPLGPAGGVSTLPQVAVAGRFAAVTFAVAHTAYLSTCRAGSCSRAVTVARSPLFPQPAVAVDPSGRVTVLWRGRTSGGALRLQWRVTTNGKLGATHTLGELGDRPVLTADPTGKVVAVWQRHVVRASDPTGLRTAARRVGEFTRPTTVQAGQVSGAQLATGASGETFAAWLRGGQAWVSRRTASSAFSAPSPVGQAGTGALALAASSDGHAVLALEHAAGPASSVVQAALRAPAAAFGTVETLSAPAFLSTAFGPGAAVGQTGLPFVTWTADALPGTATGGGSFVIGGLNPATFAGASPQTLSAATVPPSLQAPAIAAAGGQAVVAWVDAGGGHVATSGG